jgi:hypothetical protein
MTAIAAKTDINQPDERHNSFIILAPAIPKLS